MSARAAALLVRPTSSAAVAASAARGQSPRPRRGAARRRRPAAAVRPFARRSAASARVSRSADGPAQLRLACGEAAELALQQGRPLGERRLEPGGHRGGDAQRLVEPFRSRGEPLEARRDRPDGRCAGAPPGRSASAASLRDRSAATAADSAAATARAASSSTSAASSRRRASSSSSTASAVSPANHSSPRLRIPADALLGHGGHRARRAAPPVAGRAASTSSRGSRPTSTSTEPSPADAGALDELDRALRVGREDGGSTMGERRRDGALAARLDLEQLQRELLALLGERTRRRRDPLALGERLLEPGEPLAGERRRAPRDPPAHGRRRGRRRPPRRRRGRAPRATGRREPTRISARSWRSSPSSRCDGLVSHPEPLSGAAQRRAARRGHRP